MRCTQSLAPSAAPTWRCRWSASKPSAQHPPQRIGLSATQRPLETIGRFLAGGVAVGDAWKPRPVTIVDDDSDKAIDIKIVVPVEDMTAPAPTGY